jgi:hypothetical protein
MGLKNNCIIVATHLELLQDRPMDEHLSFEKVSNFNTLSLCFSSAKGFFKPLFSAPIVI